LNSMQDPGCQRRPGGGTGEGNTLREIALATGVVEIQDGNETVEPPVPDRLIFRINPDMLPGDQIPREKLGIAAHSLPGAVFGLKAVVGSPRGPETVEVTNPLSSTSPATLPALLAVLQAANPDMGIASRNASIMAGDVERIQAAAIAINSTSQGQKAEHSYGRFDPRQLAAKLRARGLPGSASNPGDPARAKS